MIAHKLTDSTIQVIKKFFEFYDLLNSDDSYHNNNPEKWLKKFQHYHQLPSTGQVDNKTQIKLNEFMTGYTLYNVKKNDELYNIADTFNTTTQKIITANPSINPFFLKEGYQLIIPYKHSLIRTKICYNYEIMKKNIEGLCKRYPFLACDTIGKSVEGRNLYRLKLGDGENQVIYNASHHACEWITTPILMKWIEDYCEAFTMNASINGFNANEIWHQSTMHVIPMVNPDGVELAINGLDCITVNKKWLKKWNQNNLDFTKWKANINGVDLNRNYDAEWHAYKKLEKQLGIIGPSMSLYSGKYPLSEPESKALADFTKTINPRLTLSYHSQGEIIFWNFRDLQPNESLDIALALCEISGYELGEENLEESYAGYKDWFIKVFKKPSFTIEVGKGVNPLPISQFNRIYEENVGLLFLASIL